MAGFNYKLISRHYSFPLSDEKVEDIIKNENNKFNKTKKIKYNPNIPDRPLKK